MQKDRLKTKKMAKNVERMVTYRKNGEKQKEL